MSATESDLFAGIMPFVAVAEARSFTVAARNLGVTTSAVSKSIAKLEAELGVRLVQRTPRAVTLTHEGALFHRECKSAVSGVRNARNRLQEMLASPRGVLRVSLPLALGELVVMPALPRLLAEHPGLTVETVLTDRLVDLIAEGFDAVVRIGRPRAPGIVQRKLPPVRWATVAAPGYLARHGTPTQPQELSGHNCLHFVLPNGTLQPWRFGNRRATTEGNLASDHPGGLVQATLAGLGILQAHRYIVAAPLAEGRLVEILADEAAPPLPLGVFYPSGDARSPRVRAFVSAMAALLENGRSL